MKILCLGDLHGQKSNVDIIKSVLEQCNELAKSVDLTVFLGDAYHEKSYCRTEIQNLYLKYFGNWNSRLILIVGNHDMTSAMSCDEHALEVFKSFRGIKVIDKIYTEIDSPNIKNNTLIFIPYMTELPELPDGDYLFGHLEIKGALHNNRPMESGFDRNIFKKYKRLICGHIHQPQDDYIGTPFSTDFGESDQQKHVAILDTDTNKIEYIELQGLPSHRTYEYSIQNKEDLPSVRKDLQSKIKPNYIVRVIINSPEGIEIKKTDFPEINIESFKCNIEKTNHQSEITESMSIVDMAEKYISKLDESIAGKVAEFSKRVLEEVK